MTVFFWIKLHTQKIILFVTKIVFMFLLLFVFPYSSGASGKKLPALQTDDFSQSYPHFDHRYFSEDSQERLYTKTPINDLVTQILDYFNRKHDAPTETPPFKYEDIIKLLPWTFQNSRHQFLLPNNAEKSEKAVFFFLNLLLATNSQVTLKDLIRYLLQVLTDLRKKVVATLSQNQSQIEQELFSISDQEYNDFLFIREEKNRLSKYIIDLLKKGKFISDSEETTFTLSLRNLVKRKYSEKYNINQKNNLAQSGLLYTFKSDIELKFGVQFAPMHIEVFFDNLDFDYYQFVKVLANFLKLVYQSSFAKNDFKNKKKVQEDFAKLFESNSEDVLDPLLTEKNSSFFKSNLLSVFLFSLKIRYKIWNGALGSKGNWSEKTNTLFGLFRDLTETSFSDKPTDKYIYLTTHPCTKPDENVASLSITLVRSYSYKNRQFGGLCYNEKNSDSDNFDTTKSIPFEFFKLYDQILSAFDVGGVGWSQSLIDGLIKDVLIASLISQLQLINVLSASASFKNRFYPLLEDLLKFDVKNFTSTQKSTSLQQQLASVYQFFQENVSFLEQGLNIKLDSLHEGNNRLQIKKLLNFGSSKVDTTQSPQWQDLDFAFDDVYIKRENNQTFLVLLINDRKLIRQKHAIVFTDVQEPKIIYYAANHYEYLIDEFISKYSPPNSDI